MVIDSIFVYHFVDPDLRVETFFEKDGAAKNGCVDFEIGDKGHSTHLYWRKFHSEPVCFLIAFLVTKEKLLKAFLTYTFIPPLLSSESRKRYTLRLLMYLEALEEGFTRLTSQEICNFFFKMFMMRFSRFWKCLNATWNSPEQPVELFQK